MKKTNLLFLVAIILLLSCSKDEKIAPVEPPVKADENVSVKGYIKTVSKDTLVKMKPNVIYVKKDINKDLEKINEEENTITFKENEQTKKIISGDVLYSKGTGDFSDAYAIKVTKVTNANGKVECKYRQANIGEVFDKLNEKQEFEVEEKGIKGYDIEKYLEYLKKKPFGRNFGNASDIQDIIDKIKLNIGDSDKFKVDVNGERIKITSIILDGDKNYKTDHDQLKIIATFTPKEPSIISDFRRGRFTSSGGNYFDLDVSLSYGRNIDRIKKEVNKELKDGIDKSNADIQKEAQGINKKLNAAHQKLKLYFAEIPLIGKSATDLVVKPVLKLYLVIESNIKGEFKISVETEYVLSHIIELSATKRYITTSLDNKNVNFNVEGDISTNVKTGPGVAIDLEFPAFKRTEKKYNEKTKKTEKEKKNSVIGISAEAFLEGTIKGQAKFDFNPKKNIKNVFYIRGSVNGGLYWEPEVYAKLGFWGYNKELSWSPDEAPYSIIQDLSYNFGYYIIPPNMSESFKMKYNSGNIKVDDYNKEVVIPKFKNDKVTLTGNNIGSTMLHLNDESAVYKKADIIVSVLANNNNKPPTKPELIIPLNNHSFDKDTKITFRWKKSTDEDNQIRYELFLKKPNATGFEKLTTYYDDLRHQYTPEQAGEHEWKIVVSDGQERVESDTYKFTVEEPQIITFKDPNFEKAVREKINKPTGDVYAKDVESITSLDISKRSIKDVTGLEYFLNLTYLYCDRSQLTNLDVSKNTKLTNLSCSSNQLTSLDVSKNTKLTNLSCSNNQLKSLDVSKNIKLTNLSCSNNQLKSLDVSKNIKLTNLSCSSNQLTSLDVSKNTELTRLYCSGNQLTSLNVSKNTKLTDLVCYGNQLTNLDVSKNINLTGLGCFGNQLTNLDVSKNTKLTYLNCYTNQLTNLDVSKNTKLTKLDCYNNQLTNLDVSKNTKLTKLDCYNNQLTNLDVSKNTKLKYLNCHTNQLTNLDVSKNTKLKYLNCHTNQLTNLDVANSNNANLNWLFADKNPNLKCIQIDKGFTPPLNGGRWRKDDVANYSTNCN